MNHTERSDFIEGQPVTSPEEMDQAIREVEGQEQLYSIALFDILGFSNFVEKNGTQRILELYNKLIELIHRVESDYDGNTSAFGSVVPVPTSADWKSNQFVADGKGYIHACHFSDTFIIYVNYIFEKKVWWLSGSFYEPYPLLLGEIGTEYSPIFYEKHHIYISFLQLCMEFFCESVKMGIPLRGCIATGRAMMDKHQSIFFGRPLVEAARGEPALNAIGVSFGRSFNNYHPVYNSYFIPYLEHIKEDRKEFLSPMMLDWPRFWRNHPALKDLSIGDCINKMNTNPAFGSYYDNAIKFANFSEQNMSWPAKINRESITDIIDYYDRVTKWYKSIN